MAARASSGAERGRRAWAAWLTEARPPRPGFLTLYLAKGTLPSPSAGSPAPPLPRAQAFAPMAPYSLALVQRMAAHFGLRAGRQGSGRRRFLVVSATPRSGLPDAPGRARLRELLAAHEAGVAALAPAACAPAPAWPSGGGGGGGAEGEPLCGISCDISCTSLKHANQCRMRCLESSEWAASGAARGSACLGASAAERSQLGLWLGRAAGRHHVWRAGTCIAPTPSCPPSRTGWHSRCASRRQRVERARKATAARAASGRGWAACGRLPRCAAGAAQARAGRRGARRAAAPSASTRRWTLWRAACSNRGSRRARS